MPIFEEKIEDEEFEYYPFEDLGVSKYRKWKNKKSARNVRETFQF
jgi:hypothetical protein